MRLPIATLLLLAACDPAPREEPVASPEPKTVLKAGAVDRSQAGKAAPTAAFEDPDGEPASLADFRGKPLLLNLWATWCAPCVAELPTLDALAARDEDLQVVALSQDLAGRPSVEAFLAERKLEALEPYLDAEMAMMTALKVESLPTTILYDANGRELWRVAGERDWTDSASATLLREAVSPAAIR